MNARLGIVFAIAMGASMAVPLVKADQAPIAVTGYTRHFTVDGSSTVTATYDGGTSTNGFTFYRTGFSTGAPTTGLPTGSTFTSADTADGTTQFALQGPGNNDAILVDNGGNSGTFTLSSPAGYTSLSFLASTGSGNNLIDYTINYLGGGTQTGSFTATDWFNSSPVAIGAGGRVDATGTNFDSVSSPGNNPNLYQYDVTPNSTAAISSISFALDPNQPNGLGGGHTAIWAVSGAAAVTTPLPASAWGGLALLAGFGLVRLRRSSALA